MKRVCLLLALFCTGCGKGTAPPTVGSTPAAQPAPPPPAVSPAAPVPPTAATALASSDNDKSTARAEVLELKRLSGGMLMLKLALVNTSKEPLSLSTEFTDSHTGDVSSISGVTLVDPVNKKKYFVVRDSANNCVCSENLKDLKPSERITAWARFPSPPDDVQKLSVLIPHFPPLDELAISQ